MSVLDRSSEWEQTYALLADAYSRELLLDLLAFQVLGHEKVRLPLSRPDYWGKRRYIESHLRRARNTYKVPILGHLDLYDLHPLGIPMTLHGSALSVLNTFMLEQYRYPRSEPLVAVTAGETVVDAGGCWGDTALYFAHRAGRDGRVISFEFVPGNLTILRQNLEDNAAIAENVTVVPKAVWNVSGIELSYSDTGPGTAVLRDPADNLSAETITIDDYVNEARLERVDFIKMDIEGAELPALHGAERTLRRFKPRLALAAYHKEDDLITIPQYLSKLDIGYKFFLDHFTIHQEETVLFAL
jgi:FkbM family methyltransferase